MVYPSPPKGHSLPFTASVPRNGALCGLPEEHLYPILHAIYMYMYPILHAMLYVQCMCTCVHMYVLCVLEFNSYMNLCVLLCFVFYACIHVCVVCAVHLTRDLRLAVFGTHFVDF